MLNGHDYVAHCFLWIMVSIFRSKLEVSRRYVQLHAWLDVLNWRY